MNRYFSEDDRELTSGHVKKCSVSLTMREIQIKVIMRYHPILLRRTSINNSRNNLCWQGHAVKLSSTADGNVVWFNHCEKQHGEISVNLELSYHLIQ